MVLHYSGDTIFIHAGVTNLLGLVPSMVPQKRPFLSPVYILALVTLIWIRSSLVPRPRGRRETAWYRLLAHAQSFPEKPGNRFTFVNCR